MTNLVTVSWA